MEHVAEYVVHPQKTARYGLYLTTKKSEAASPIAVVKSFTNQNKAVISGTFLIVGWGKDMELIITLRLNSLLSIVIKGYGCKLSKYVQ